LTQFLYCVPPYKNDEGRSAPIMSSDSGPSSADLICPQVVATTTNNNDGYENVGLRVIDDGILGLGVGSLVGWMAVGSNCDGENKCEDQANRDGHLLSILAKKSDEDEVQRRQPRSPRKGNIRDNQRLTTNDQQLTTDNGGGWARRQPPRRCTAVPQASRWRREVTINHQPARGHRHGRQTPLSDS
jgi:hypothetical protein